jgi:pteridine reductase
MDLRGKVALVTGGGRRVGEITSNGGKARAFSADLSTADAPASLVRDVTQALGSLDVLVNSAAGMERTPFGEIDAARWDAIFALNLRAPFFLSQAAAPQLRSARGAIVNIADLAAFETWPAYIPHGLSKGGVVQMTRALARVLAPEIRVNAIAPGTVLLPDDFSEAAAEHLNATTPLKRQGSPDDVAGAMLYLLDADYVTGETIIVDGGRHVRK